MTNTIRNSVSESSGWRDAKFFLNGSVIHLRQPCFYYGQRMQVGENVLRDGTPDDVDTRGDAADSGRNLDDADRKGYLVADYVLNANKYMMNSERRARLGAEPGSAPSSAPLSGCGVTATIRPL